MVQTETGALDRRVPVPPQGLCQLMLHDKRTRPNTGPSWNLLPFTFINNGAESVSWVSQHPGSVQSQAPTTNIPLSLIMFPSLSPSSISRVHRVNSFLLLTLWFQKNRLQLAGVGWIIACYWISFFLVMQNTGSIQSINTSYPFFSPIKCR